MLAATYAKRGDTRWVMDFFKGSPAYDMLLVGEDGWQIRDRTADGWAMRSITLGLMVIVSGDTEDDGRRWIHISISGYGPSRQGRLPSWDDMTRVKDMVLGDERYGYQVFPPRERYVNIHPYTLHIWHCVDAPMPLPDFTRGGKSI